MKKVVVFGSFNMDLSASVPRFISPGETIMGGRLVTSPGGKGSNQAFAAHRAGADVSFITRIGADTFGEAARKLYCDEGMSTEYMLVSETDNTSSAVILVEETSAQNMIVVNEGACAVFNEKDILIAEKAVSSGDLLLTQLETDLNAVSRVISAAHKNGLTVILNPAPAAVLPDETLAMVDIITPNETETGLLTGIFPKDFESCRLAAASLMSKGIKKVVITMGSRGAFAADAEHSEIIPSYPAKAVDTTGAGDVFNGAMVAAMAEETDFFEAIRFGCAAAAVSVERRGAALSAPTIEEIKAKMQKKV